MIDWMLCFFLNICVAWYKSSDMKVSTLKVVFFEEGGVTGVEMTVSNRRFDLVYISELWQIKRSFSIFIMKKAAVPLLKFTNKEVNYSEHSQRKLFFFHIIWMAQKKSVEILSRIFFIQKLKVLWLFYRSTALRCSRSL